MNTDTRVNSLDALIKYLKDSGYDGIEMCLENFKDLYFKDSKLSDEEIVNIVKSKFDKAGLNIFGVLMHSRDNDWNKENVDQHLKDLKESLYFNKKLGAEYATFQVWLPDKYMTGDGSYRNDDGLITEFNQRINILQDICYEQGLNFYVETHVGRISEDPEALIKLIDTNDGEFELNGDLSHYICRGMLKGPYMERILNKIEHTHVRMARVYGDLSVNVDDPVKDWNNPEGITRTYWDFAKKGFQNGLSSRVIVGEAGPKHLVDDALAQDQRMVPLLRAMADYCDKQVEKGNLEKESFNPFTSQTQT